MRHTIKNRSVDPFLLLRAFACVLVIGSHVQRPELRAGMLKLPFAWMHVFNGHFGVWIFFMLSGYLIGKGFFTGRYVWSAQGLQSYYLRRVTKVYVPYAITAIILLMYYRVGMVRFFNEMTSVLLLRGNEVYGVNELSYLWTISSIVLWYVIAPIVCRLFLFFRNKKSATLLLGAGILIFGQVLRAFYITWYPAETFPEFNAGVFIHFLPNLYFFLIGVWANLVVHPLLLDRRSLGVGGAEKYFSIAGLLIAYLVATYYLAGVYWGYSWSFAGYGMTAPFLTILSVLWCIIVVEKEKYERRDSSLFVRSLLLPLALIGLYSYQMYLMQTPIIKILKLECSSDWCPLPVVFFRSVLVILLSLGISFGGKEILRLFASMLSWRRHEVPSE